MALPLLGTIAKGTIAKSLSGGSKLGRKSKGIFSTRKKPKVVKVVPSARTRVVTALNFDRKSDYEKFLKWLTLSTDELNKITLPKKKELKDLEKNAKSLESEGGGGGLLGLIGGGLASIVGGNLLLGGLPKLLKTKFPKLPVTPFLKAATKAATGASGKKLKPKPGKGGKPGSGTKLKPKPGKGGTPRVTTTGGRGVDRPIDIRNPLRKKPDVTTTGGAKAGTPIDIRNPLRKKPDVTTGMGGTAKLSVKQFISSLSEKSGLNLAKGLTKKFIIPIFKRIPVIGALIDFAINYFIFKESLGKSAFKAIGASLGSVILGALLSIVPVIGSAIGAVLGGMAGDTLGGLLYEAFFEGREFKYEYKEPRAMGRSAAKNRSKTQTKTQTETQSNSGYTPRRSASMMKTNVSKVYHKDTGSGYQPAGAKDYQGRPVTLSQNAAVAFAKMMKDSKGVVKGSDVWSSQRSKEKNDSLPNAAPNSNHLYGNALDIHNESQTWMKANGAKYGWNIQNYKGSHGGHFNFKPVPMEDELELEMTGDPPQNSIKRTSIKKPKLMKTPQVVTPNKEESFMPIPKMETVPMKTNVKVFSPEAEAANNNNVIIMVNPSQPQTPQQSSPNIIPIPMGGGGGSSSQNSSSSISLNSLRDSLLLTKLED